MTPCRNTSCTLKEGCKRYITLTSSPQWSSIFSYKLDKNNKIVCEHYIKK